MISSFKVMFSKIRNMGKFLIGCLDKREHKIVSNMSLDYIYICMYIYIHRKKTKKLSISLKMLLILVSG